MKNIFLVPFIALSILTVSCSTVPLTGRKSLKLSQMNHSVDSAKAASGTLPTKEEYQAMRDSFLSDVNEFLANNQSIRKSQSSSGKTFSTVSIIVGGAGGLAGLFATDSKVGSVSSIVVGVISGLAVKGYSKDEEDKASDCITLITKVKANFEATWPAFKVPATEDEYKELVKDIKAGNDAIGNANCFGNEAN